MKAFLLLLTLLVAAGCSKTEAPAPVAAGPRTYAVRGVVQEIPADRRHATIKHEKIPGFMSAMTMDFSVKDTNVLNSISAGDEISFSLLVTENDDWIENVKRTGSAAVTLPPGWSVGQAQLNVGDALPDFEFTTESGARVRFADFRGQAVAFTFFFTSCPLPEYCPRMNKHFAEARKLLVADVGGPTNWQFLSLSFDSDFDKPEILGGYGSFYRGTNTSQWLFAVASSNTMASLAPKVDLSFWKENGTFSHNLRTVVLDAQGKIAKQFDGNDWTPEQLAAAMREAALKK